MARKRSSKRSTKKISDSSGALMRMPPAHSKAPCLREQTRSMRKGSGDWVELSGCGNGDRLVCPRAVGFENWGQAALPLAEEVLRAGSVLLRLRSE